MKDIEATCISKQQYPTAAVALAVAHDYLVFDGVRQVPYRCSICKVFHLTRANERVIHQRSFKKAHEKARKVKFNYHHGKHKRQ